MPRKLRGNELDERLEKVLAEMLAQGYREAPISRSAVQKRLGLKSRGTLGGERATRIMKARTQQMELAGPYSDSKQVRRSLEEKNEHLKQKVAELISDRDRYVEQLMHIVQLLQSKGINVEEHLTTLRPNRSPGLRN